MKTYKLYINISLIFLLGTVIGALATAIYIKHRIQEVFRGDNAIIQQLVAGKLDYELSLTASQSEEIRQIVRQVMMEIYQIRKKNQPEIERVIESGAVSIKTRLDPKQSARLDSLLQKFKENWKLKY